MSNLWATLTMTASTVAALTGAQASRTELSLLNSPPEWTGQAEDTKVLPDGVTRHRNLIYTDGEKRDAVRHRLDLYVPAGDGWADGRPLIIWIHGGGWQFGSKDDMLGLYGKIGRRLAARGIAFANINYRLTPRVRHPGHIEDAAAAFAFLRRHAEEYGFDPDHVFVSGHSAGGHLAALLATDPQWLAEYDLDHRRVIAGAIPISGVYDLRGFREFMAEVETRRERRIRRQQADNAPGEDEGDADNEGEPNEQEDGIGRAAQNENDGNTNEIVTATPSAAPASTRRWQSPFPPGTYTDASPILHADRDDPPFLVIHESVGELMGRQAREFVDELTAGGATAEIVVVEGENHISMLLDMLRPNNTAVEAMVRFVQTRAAAEGDANPAQR